MEYIFGLVGSVSLVTIIKYLVDHGKRLQKFENIEKRVFSLENKVSSLETEVDSIKNSTEVRLAKIETQLINLTTNVIEVSKDVKLILKGGRG